MSDSAMRDLREDGWRKKSAHDIVAVTHSLVGIVWKSRFVPLATRKFRQTLLPNTSQTHFDFQTIGYGFSFGGLQFGSVSSEQLTKNVTKVPNWRKEAVLVL